jgi:hypothetical protein
MVLQDPRLALSGRLALDYLNRTHPILARVFLLKGELASLRTSRRPVRRKYSPDQPRDEAGRWTDGGGIAPDGTPIDRTGTSGFSTDEKQMTVQQFKSKFCRGDIRAVLPGQFLDWTIADVIMEAKQGNKVARKCLKLLETNRFGK